MKRILFGLAQAAVFGLMLGITLLVGSRVWRPTVAQAAGKIPDVVKAKGFQVVDGAGKVRIAIGFGDKGNPSLRLYDDKGKACASLSDLAFTIQNASGESSAGLWISSDGSPTIGLYSKSDKYYGETTMDSTHVLLAGKDGIATQLVHTGIGLNAGKSSAGLWVSSDGPPTLGLSSKSDKHFGETTMDSTHILFTGKDGTASQFEHAGMALNDAAGNVRGVFTLLTGEPELVLNDAAEKARGTFRLTNGEPGLFLNDASGKICGMFKVNQGNPDLSLLAGGKPRAGLCLLSDGNPNIAFFDENAKLRLILGATSLINPQTKVQRTTPVSSMTLFDDGRDVVFKVPPQ